MENQNEELYDLRDHEYNQPINTPPQNSRDFIDLVTRIISPYQLPANYPKKIESYLKEYGSVVLLDGINGAKLQYIDKYKTPKIDKFLEKLGGVLYYQSRPVLRLIFICKNIMASRSYNMNHSTFESLSIRFIRNYGYEPLAKGTALSIGIHNEIIEWYLSFILKPVKDSRLDIFYDYEDYDWDTRDLYDILKGRDFKQYSQFEEQILDYFQYNTLPKS